VTAVNVFESNGDGLSKVLNTMSIFSRQIIEIFVVLIGKNEDVPFIVGPPPCCHQRGDPAILIHQILRAVDQVIATIKPVP
jgi:hypothetical protein